MAIKLNLAGINVTAINTVFTATAVNVPGDWETFPEETWEAARLALVEEYKEMTKEEQAAACTLYFNSITKIVEARDAAASYGKKVLASRKAAATSLFTFRDQDVTDELRTDLAAIHEAAKRGELDAALDARIGSFGLWLSAMGIDTTNRLALSKAYHGILDCAGSLVTAKGEYKKGYALQKTLLKGFVDWATRVHKQLVKEDGSYRVKGH